MLMFVILVGAIGLLAFNNLSEIAARLRFLEAADHLTNDILEARRVEKNYFLYKDPESLAEAGTYLDEAELALSRLSGQKGGEVSEEGINAVRGRLHDYRQALARVQRGGGAETALRDAGHSLISLTSRMAAEEQARVEFLITFSKQAMTVSFAVLLTLGLFGAYFVGQRIVRPLGLLDSPPSASPRATSRPCPAPSATTRRARSCRPSTSWSSISTSAPSSSCRPARWPPWAHSRPAWPTSSTTP